MEDLAGFAVAFATLMDRVYTHLGYLTNERSPHLNLPMFIGYFTESPYIDLEADWLKQGAGSPTDLALSNEAFDPALGADLWDRWIEESVDLEEAGFDGVMLNEHHATPFTMRGGNMNLQAAVLARMTEKLKIVLLGNILPIWDNPIRLYEELTTVDLMSRGRLVSGFVRGTGRESVATNSQPPFNRERFQEAHDFLIKAWTTDGPFRWEGEHYDLRYVNPFMKSYQRPHPPIWIPGVFSRATVEFAATHRYPYIMLESRLELTQQVFAIYDEFARASGFEPGPQHHGYIIKMIVDEDPAKAFALGRKFIEGPGNIFLEGSAGRVNPYAQNLPGLNPRPSSGGQLPTGSLRFVQASRGIGAKGSTNLRGSEYVQGDVDPETRRAQIYQGLINDKLILVGTPDSVMPTVRYILELLRPGNFLIWSGDGAMSHDESMRCIRLMGEEVLPRIREIGDELGLKSSFEIDPATGADISEAVAATS
jgi:alkanesulfonate monooxygenase SsuD/methylene tetrahydromethanopterin reductase-like flavin-dependent oxidoreductase (luciferase family)